MMRRWRRGVEDTAIQVRLELRADTSVRAVVADWGLHRGRVRMSATVMTSEHVEKVEPGQWRILGRTFRVFEIRHHWRDMILYADDSAWAAWWPVVKLGRALDDHMKGSAYWWLTRLGWRPPDGAAVRWGLLGRAALSLASGRRGGRRTPAGPRPSSLPR